MSITKYLTKTRMSALMMKKISLGIEVFLTADRKIMSKAMQRPKFILTDVVTSSSCVTERQELFLISMALFYFYLFKEFLTILQIHFFHSISLIFKVSIIF